VKTRRSKIECCCWMVGTPVLYSGNLGFTSRPGDWLPRSRIFAIFLSLSKQMSAQYRKLTFCKSYVIFLKLGYIFWIWFLCVFTCLIIHNVVNIQGEHKRTLHFQNDTENKCGVFRTSHLHQSIEKHSQFCFKWPGWLLLRASARCH
jgi:hypothetical protein